MKAGRGLAIWMAAVLLLAAGCGGSASGAGNASAGSGGAMEYTQEADGAAGAPQEPGAAQEGNSVYRNSGAKLIRRAELTIQTTQFDQAAANLEQLVQDCGGYFEQASVHGGSYRDANASRWGEYIVRVPAEQYEAFKSGSSGIGYLIRSNESSEDVGELYYDTEARLKTQRTKQERLLSLLEQAATMEDIIELENALSEVEYQIEQLSSTLNRYDALISYSTFTITLEETVRVNQEVGESSSLGQRMSAGVKASMEGVVVGAQNALVWISYHLFGVAVFAAVCVAAVVVGRKKLKALKASREEKET